MRPPPACRMNRVLYGLPGNKGLQRFDGQRYLTFGYQKNNPSAIPYNYIIQLLMDKKKKLWVLTGDGKIGTFDTKRFLYTEVKVKVKNEKILIIRKGTY